MIAGSISDCLWTELCHLGWRSCFSSVLILCEIAQLLVSTGRQAGNTIPRLVRTFA